MEKVLDVYKRPYDVSNPVVCMDESPKQLIKETRKNIPITKGIEARTDYEYERCGVCNIFIANEPLRGKRVVKITERKTRTDWAEFIKQIVDENYPKAKRIWDRFEFVYTPKHGSWLNMAEIELNVLMGQCLNRNIDNLKTKKHELAAWQNKRNNKNSKINWQFTTKDARIKLKKLYPSIQN